MMPSEARQNEDDGRGGCDGSWRERTNACVPEDTKRKGSSVSPVCLLAVPSEWRAHLLVVSDGPRQAHQRLAVEGHDRGPRERLPTTFPTYAQRHASCARHAVGGLLWER